MYEFEVPGKITGKARPRVNTLTGRAYTPGNTKDYEMLIKQYFKVKYPRYETLEGRIIIKIEAYFEPPKSTSKKQTEQMLENKISPTKKPDIDNIIKIVLDALNKMAFRDIWSCRKNKSKNRHILNRTEKVLFFIIININYNK